MILHFVWYYSPNRDGLFRTSIGRLHQRFLLVFQIRWKFCLALIPLLAIRSQQIVAQATTAQLTWHIQNHYNIQSRGFDISWDLTVRRFTAFSEQRPRNIPVSAPKRLFILFPMCVRMRFYVQVWPRPCIAPSHALWKTWFVWPPHPSAQWVGYFV